jgi:hypothetical protein
MSEVWDFPKIRFITLPVDGGFTFDWAGYDKAYVPPKRPQRGGVPKGRSWRREAAVDLANAIRCRRLRQWTLGRMAIFMALDTIYRHARKPATRTEALRLLTVLEARG